MRIENEFRGLQPSARRSDQILPQGIDPEHPLHGERLSSSLKARGQKLKCIATLSRLRSLRPVANTLSRLKRRRIQGDLHGTFGEGMMGVFPQLKGLFVAGFATGRFSVTREDRLVRFGFRGAVRICR